MATMAASAAGITCQPRSELMYERHDGAEGDHLAVGEVRQPGRPVDQRQPDRRDRDDHRQFQSVGERLRATGSTCSSRRGDPHRGRTHGSRAGSCRPRPPATSLPSSTVSPSGSVSTCRCAPCTCPGRPDRDEVHAVGVGDRLADDVAPDSSSTTIRTSGTGSVTRSPSFLEPVLHPAGDRLGCVVASCA